MSKLRQRWTAYWSLLTAAHQLSILECEIRGRNTVSCSAGKESRGPWPTCPQSSSLLWGFVTCCRLLSQTWSCLERVCGEKYPVRGLVWLFLVFCMLTGSLWRLRTLPCVCPDCGSAGLYHLNNGSRWSSCSTVFALDLKFCPRYAAVPARSAQMLCLQWPWKSVTGRNRSSHNHWSFSTKPSLLLPKLFWIEAKENITRTIQKTASTVWVKKIKEIQLCLCPTVTLLLFFGAKGKHSVMEHMTNIMCWGRSSLLQLNLQLFVAIKGITPQPGSFFCGFDFRLSFLPNLNSSL